LSLSDPVLRIAADRKSDALAGAGPFRRTRNEFGYGVFDQFREAAPGLCGVLLGFPRQLLVHPDRRSHGIIIFI
jgi:hypothetical protein